MDAPVAGDMGAPVEVEIEPLETLSNGQLKDYRKLTFKLTKKISRLNKDGLRDLIVGLRMNPNQVEGRWYIY